MSRATFCPTPCQSLNMAEDIAIRIIIININIIISIHTPDTDNGTYAALCVDPQVGQKIFWEISPKSGWVPNKVQTPQDLPKSPRKSSFSTRISPFFTSTLKYSWKNPHGRLAPRSAFRAEISMSGTSISRIPNHKPGQTDCNDLHCNNCHPMFPRDRCL